MEPINQEQGNPYNMFHVSIDPAYEEYLNDKVRDLYKVISDLNTKQRCIDDAKCNAVELHNAIGFPSPYKLRFLYGRDFKSIDKTLTVGYGIMYLRSTGGSNDTSRTVQSPEGCSTKDGLQMLTPVFSNTGICLVSLRFQPLLPNLVGEPMVNTFATDADTYRGYWRGDAFNVFTYSLLEFCLSSKTTPKPLRLKKEFRNPNARESLKNYPNWVFPNYTHIGSLPTEILKCLHVLSREEVLQTFGVRDVKHTPTTNPYRNILEPNRLAVILFDSIRRTYTYDNLRKLHLMVRTSTFGVEDDTNSLIYSVVGEFNSEGLLASHIIIYDRTVEVFDDLTFRVMSLDVENYDVSSRSIPYRPTEDLTTASDGIYVERRSNAPERRTQSRLLKLCAGRFVKKCLAIGDWRGKKTSDYTFPKGTSIAEALVTIYDAENFCMIKDSFLSGNDMEDITNLQTYDDFIKVQG